jgi:predicted nucleic acid-binding protein
MALARWRKFVLDTNCFVDASRSDADAGAFAEFCAWAAPRLYLSTVVAAELRAGAGSEKHRRTLERQILAPYCVAVVW